MTTYEYRTTIEVDVVVTYGREPYQKAQVHGPVEGCYPAEGGGLTDVMVQLVSTNGTRMGSIYGWGLAQLIGEKAYAELEDELHAHADDEDRYDDGDRRRDEMRDRELEGDE